MDGRRKAGSNFHELSEFPWACRMALALVESFQLCGEIGKNKKEGIQQTNQHENPSKQEKKRNYYFYPSCLSQATPSSALAQSSSAHSQPSTTTNSDHQQPVIKAIIHV
ncbi:hypothetical protein Pst134EA_007084 [Puccinia striiformis f. sp. tritici]|uniref:hypothetical protein n=1 Tax=Puccinia striiformis f. sp. tritici TaxID=168172 RepID=UPI002008ADBF|nr:hypothetical protein Pst134EA_007084 [Puccinia striiformis f. sp. tritici]KAH9469807.1 hypothetical protein Pst134EA_007084 [Puccinia striiformis f. sp. tritici]